MHVDIILLGYVASCAQPDYLAYRTMTLSHATANISRPILLISNLGSK